MAPRHTRVALLAAAVLCAALVVPALAAECGTQAGYAEAMDCTCDAPGSGSSVAAAIDYDASTHEFVGHINGAHNKGVRVTEVALGQGKCLIVDRASITCDCFQCRFRVTQSTYSEYCGWTKQQLPGGRTAVSVPMNVAYNKTTRNVFGDEETRASTAEENVVQVVTAVLHTGFVDTPTARLVDMLIVQDSLTPAAIGSDAAMQSITLQLDSSMPLDLLPSASFDNTEVSGTARVTSPACSPGAALCRTTVELELIAPVQEGTSSCSFAGIFSLPFRPDCAGCADFTATVDLSAAEYDGRYCVTQEKELSGKPSIGVELLNPVATATQPAQFRVTAELRDDAGALAPSTLTRVVAYHPPEGEHVCSPSAPSGTIVDSTGVSLVDYVTVAPDGNPDADQHSFTFSIYATEEDVRKVLELPGASHAMTRLRNQYGFRICFGILLTSTLGARLLSAPLPLSTLTMGTTIGSQPRATAAAGTSALASGADTSAELSFDPTVPVGDWLHDQQGSEAGPGPGDSGTAGFIGSTGFVAIVVAAGFVALVTMAVLAIAVASRRRAAADRRHATKQAHTVPAVVVVGTSV